MSLYYLLFWQNNNMENTTLRNCLVPCCNGQHFLKFRNSKALITASDFFKICRHFTKNVHDICDF